MRSRPLRLVQLRLYFASRLSFAMCCALFLNACETAPDSTADASATSPAEAALDAAAVDLAAVDSAPVDSAAAARLDALRAAAATSDSLAETDLDSMLTALDLDARTPDATPPNAASQDAAEQQADSLLLPPSALADSMQASADLNARIAALEGQIEALTEVLAASLAATQPTETDSTPADSLGRAERARETVEDVRNTAGRLGWKIFFALIVGISSFYLIRLTTYVLDTLAARTAERRLFYKRLIPILRIGIWLFTAYIIIKSIFGLGTNELVAAGAALGVAIGFAAQDALKNVFGGLIIVFDQPFQVGDKIAVGGTYGEVIEIGLRSTRIVTPDDNLVSVPNAQVADGQVSNANAGALDCQVVTDLYLPGWVDVHQAKQIAYEAASTSKYVYLDKPIVVICKDEFKETFLLHLKVKAYVLDTRYEFLLMSDVTEAAKAAFRKAGLLEPMPVRSYLVEPSPPATPGASSPPADAPSTQPSPGDGARRAPSTPGTA
ncbi:MAG: mechanosensitive ion channel domain-containing protein [Bacteroidota bacterium]